LVKKIGITLAAMVTVR